jgi:hypothetical protein
MDKPVIRSIHEFSEYTAVHIGYARKMRHLSRNDEYLVRLDKLMGERWGSVVNGNSPTPEQRRAALEERENVQNLLPRLQAATRELLVLLQSLQAYANALPLPPGEAGGWALRADLEHPDRTVKMLTAALDDVKCLHGLDESNAVFAGLREQLLEMARWTRTSLNPSPEDRAKVRLGEVTREGLEVALREVVTKVCRSFHDFCELYAAFPQQEPRYKLGLEPVAGFRKE